VPNQPAIALPSLLPARLIAFYLPQFHPIPENDAWWGDGFTEWRNVTQALPQFEGHQQPRLPADLGFYDLRSANAMEQQAELARRYGVEGFCAYFYWFGGKRLLETPLQIWLENPSLQLPLCLCWANERWARNWDGRSGITLIDQQHSAADDLAFIAHVVQYLKDPRYIRVDGKPLLLVYRPGLLPDAAATAHRWRQWCRDHGVGELHLAYVQGFERPDPTSIGFDAAVEFPPNLATPPDLTDQQQLINPAYGGTVLDWRALANEVVNREMPAYRLYPAVNPGWDNEPRRAGTGRTYLHASPRGFRDWLRTTTERRLSTVDARDRLVFINAWNEWAEGAVLEPDIRLGHAWLKATRDALLPLPTRDDRPHAVIHAWYLDTLPEILTSLLASGLPWKVILTTSPGQRDALNESLADCTLDWHVETYENRGRDVLPFLHVANRLLDEGVTWILKLHTKQSTHRNNGPQWLTQLLEQLAGTRARGLHTYALATSALGLIAPEGHLLPLNTFMGGNAHQIAFLEARCGLPNSDFTRTVFASGSMYWVRLEALRPLLDAHLCVDDFETENGQIDGTFAHAIERIIVRVIQASGHEHTTAAFALGLPESDAIKPYAFAKPG
jgi:lipopolysaccharide biosynthesis protein